MRRNTPDDYHKLAQERGFRWTGPEVPNCKTKTGWECERGHRWKAIFNTIREGYGCPFCAGRARKVPADYRSLAKARGFHWVGPQVPNNAAKTGWECEHGHRWEARYNNIWQGSGCPFCAGRARKIPADFHALAEKRGFCWVGPHVPNTRTKTFWECRRGHRWETAYNPIQQGSGCPFCSGRRKDKR